MASIPRWRRYLRFWGTDVDADVEDELRFHLERRTADYERLGMARQDAERAARERLGDLEAVREALRSHDHEKRRREERHERMSQLAQDLRYAARGLRLHPGFTATAVLTIALGIGANATVFGILDQILFRPPAHVRHPERIQMISTVWRGAPGIGQQSFSYPVYRTLRQELGSVDGVAMAMWSAEDLPVGRGAQAQSARTLLVSASYFPLLGVSPQRGRFFAPEEDTPPAGEPVAVISDGFWTRRFARDPDVLGKTLEIGDQRYTVIGVAPPSFTGTELGGVDLWLPIAAGLHMLIPGLDWSTNSVASYGDIFVRLRPGISASRSAAEIERVLQTSFGEFWFIKDRHVRLTPLESARSVNLGTGSTVTLLLASMSLLVLLIACANLTNLLLARALRRRQEIAVRLALGVSRARLVRLLVAESVLLACLGGLAALVVVWWGGGIVRSLLFADIRWVGGMVDGRVLLFTSAAALATGILAGLVPALQTSRPDLTNALKSGTRGGGGQRARTRAGLLVVQAALAVVLLVGAGLFVRSLEKVTSLRMGVQPDRVLYGYLPLSAAGYSRSEVRAVYASALARVRALPGIAHASVALTIPFGVSYGISVRRANGDSLPPADGPSVNLIDRDYFATIGARIVQGRAFSDRDVAGSPRVAIVSEAMARRLWPGAPAVGQCLLLETDSLPCARVVGVAEDVRRQDILENPTYFVYEPLAQAGPQTTRWLHDLFIVARPSGDAGRMIEPVRRALQTAAPALPYALVQRISDIPEVVSQLRRWRLSATLFAAFGVLALVLASVGLFGVVSYSVTQRVHEIGVRMALGARPANVARLVIGQAVALSATGLVIGLGAALAGAPLIASTLYGVTPHDPVVYATVAATLVLVAVVASVIPARRATRVDPVEVLRAE